VRSGVGWEVGGARLAAPIWRAHTLYHFPLGDKKNTLWSNPTCLYLFLQKRPRHTFNFKQ
jgi:hypothetical protein